MGELEGLIFVVIGRNQCDRLRLCLESVLTLSNAVVYADSASTDGSADLARSLGVSVVEIDSPPLNAARGRREGLIAAQSEFPHADLVQFVDGDCVLASTWPAIAVRFLRSHPTAGVVCGRRREEHPQASFYNRLADFEWDTPVGRTAACGGDAMMRIAALDEVGGFDPSLMASEEPELCSRLGGAGWEIWRLDSAMTGHDAAMFSFPQWWRRTVRSGYGYAQVWHKNGLPLRGSAASQLSSALIWAVLFPVVVGLGAALTSRFEALAFLPVGYLVQTARIAPRFGDDAKFRWRAAALVMIAKFAEVAGAVRFLLSSNYSRSIEYKRSSR